MISKELKYDFREMSFGTFAAAFEDLIYSWEKKTFPSEMGISRNEWKSFFQENAPQPPRFRFRASNLSKFESENSIGWKRLGYFIRLHLDYRRR